jgi:hypothetical protein
MLAVGTVVPGVVLVETVVALGDGVMVGVAVTITVE